MIRPALAALFLLVPVCAFADSQLDRMETVSEQMSLEISKMMVREISNLGGDTAPLIAAMPDTTWDDEYRAAGACMLEQFNAAAGPDAVDSMLTKMEAMIPTLATATLDSVSDLDMLPAGMTQEQSMQITQSCGMVELSMQRMQESGFSAAMMQAYQGTQGN